MEKLQALEKLTEALSSLPSVGKRSAERMAIAMLNMSDEELKDFSDAIINLKKKIHYCPICGSLTEKDICEVCNDNDRDHSTILVVSNPKDVLSFESNNTYKGIYHVLGGTISLSKGQGIDSLNISSLIERVKNGGVNEVILATNPTVDGETTALYISKLLTPYNIKISRLAYGLPMGGNLDYVDALTLEKAIEGRQKL